MSIEKKIFAVKKYSEVSQLLTRWYVKVKVPCYVTGTFKWKKCYGDINKYTTIDERIAAMDELESHILLTQDYKNVQGGRSVGYVYEGFVTDIVFQLKKVLDLRKFAIRLSTQRKYAGQIKNMQDWLKLNGKLKLPVATLSQDDAACFFNYLMVDKKLSNVSYNSHLQMLKTFYKILMEQEVCTKNPFAGLRTLPKMCTPSLYYSDTQKKHLGEILERTDKNLFHFVQFIYYCFIRPNEIRHLKIKDINVGERKIKIDASFSKNKKTQFVSIPSQLVTTLLEMRISEYDKEFYLFGSRGLPSKEMIGENTMKTRHRNILIANGYSLQHKLYSWKHTGAISCTKAGMNIKDLQMQLRHHSLDQVNIYLQSMLVFESEFIKESFPTL